MLSRELKALTTSGLIDRKDFGEVPPKVEYRLTRKRQEFCARRRRHSRMGRASPR
ncbi:winged helix-turn-helix transcriptional regulator [Bradyrhizobium betae]